MKKLIILLLGAKTKKIIMKRKVKSTKERRNSKTTRTTRTKVRNIVSWLKILMIVKMK